ncbi:hypothetical protein HWV62_875 [Athelia sp. TMB]|nr:hypothetical protein HWV62_875 [Athelia sp. TMB]
MSASANPIIIVTGANGGVGYGICQRLLFQLATPHPSDALPQEKLVQIWGPALEKELPLSNVEGLTLIMACRSALRAEKARSELYAAMDAHVESQKKLPNYDGHAEKFRKNLVIAIHSLDLASITSVFRFGAEMAQKYPYISHLICNAGVASFINIEWFRAIKQCFTEPITAVTAPRYYRQREGEVSADGLGWVWQCNVFGHYCLFRSLQPLLAASKSALGARVIWTSSLEADPSFYDSEDWQLTKTAHSYESSKYQVDIMATHLDRLALQGARGDGVVIRHVVTQPGVAHSEIAIALTGAFLNVVKLITFYLARWLNSPNHTIQVYKAAIAAVHLSFISLAFLPAVTTPASTKQPPVRFGAETDRWGDERVGTTPVKEWDAHVKEGIELLDKCDNLYNTFLADQDSV